MCILLPPPVNIRCVGNSRMRTHNTRVTIYTNREHAASFYLPAIYLCANHPFLLRKAVSEVKFPPCYCRCQNRFHYLKLSGVIRCLPYRPGHPERRCCLDYLVVTLFFNGNINGNTAYDIKLLTTT